MEVITLLKNEEHYKQTIKLDGYECIFKADWNEREQFWYFSILELDGTSIRGLINNKIVVNWRLNRFVIHETFPKGVLLAINENDIDPNFYNLKLIWVPEIEWIAIQASV